MSARRVWPTSAPTYSPKFHNFQDAKFYADLATLHGGSTRLTPLFGAFPIGMDTVLYSLLHPWTASLSAFISSGLKCQTWHMVCRIFKSSLGLHNFLVCSFVVYHRNLISILHAVSAHLCYIYQSNQRTIKFNINDKLCMCSTNVTGYQSERISWIPVLRIYS